MAADSEVGGLSDSEGDGTFTPGGDKPRNNVVATGEERDGQAGPTGGGGSPPKLDGAGSKPSRR